MKINNYEPGFEIEEVISHWDRVAYKYDECNSNKFNFHHWRFIEGMKYIDSSDSNNINVLSILSRTGDAIPYIKKKLPNSTIHNLEVSMEMIKIAHNKYPEESFIRTDLSRINLLDRSIDYIICPETLEHTPYPHKLISEFYRVLKTDGTLILSMPPPIADFHIMVYELLFPHHGEGPRKGLSIRLVKHILLSEGFQLIKHRAILMFPIGPKWFIEFGNFLTDHIPILRGLGVMQFYICKKK